MSKNVGFCNVSGCSRDLRLGSTRGMCVVHYNRFKRWGDPRPDIPIREKGVVRWHQNENGYMQRYIYYTTDDGDRKRYKVLQHRVVMESAIGRKLESGENVHHINGNRADNRLENLELWSESQPPGQRIVDKVIWAREIIEKYGSLVM